MHVDHGFFLAYQNTLKLKIYPLHYTTINSINVDLYCTPVWSTWGVSSRQKCKPYHPSNKWPLAIRAVPLIFCAQKYTRQIFYSLRKNIIRSIITSPAKNALQVDVGMYVYWAFGILTHGNIQLARFFDGQFRFLWQKCCYALAHSHGRLLFSRPVTYGPRKVDILAFICV